MPLVIVSTDSKFTLDANAADTEYYIAQGVTIDPLKGGRAIDATSDAPNRSFVIDGHLGGTYGIHVGFDDIRPSGIHITVGDWGKIDSQMCGVTSMGDDAVIVNHGEIFSNTGIAAEGNGVSVENTGLISSSTIGLDLGGDQLEVKNSGVISSEGDGVRMNTAPGWESTFTNTGTVSGTRLGVWTYYGDDTVINQGTINGGVLLDSGNDTYDGKGGVVHGTVEGGAGHDVLKGGGKMDTLSGGIGHDVMTGRGSADVFIFSTHFGADTVTDFQATGAHHDKIDLGQMKGFNSFDDLAGHMHQNGNDAVINFGHGDVLTLHNVDFHDLASMDFIA